MNKLVSIVSSLGLSLIYSIAIADPPDVPSAPTTRAEVKAETRAAEKAELIPRGEASYNMHKNAGKSILPRAEVKAETRTAEREDEIPVGQQSLDMGKDETPSTLPRAEVKIETREAIKDHEIPRGESDVNN